MAEKTSSETVGVVSENKSRSEDGGSGGGIVIEASWAPKDPRDKLYDSTATSREKTVSLVRIFASFHPVLNSIVLTSDMVRRLGPVKSLLILCLLAVTVAGFMFL